MKLLRLLHREQQGQVLAITAAGLVALLLFVAMSIDVGLLAQEKRRLQSIADAAALAGAQRLPDDPGGAEADALAWAAKNGAGSNGRQVEVEFPDSGTGVQNDSIQVRVANPNYPLLFGRVAGIANGAIRAQAAARVGSLTGLTGLAPFGVLEGAIQYCTYQQLTSPSPPPACLTTLKYDIQDIQNADIGYVDFDNKGGGAAEVRNFIISGNKNPVCAASQPGPEDCQTAEPMKSGQTLGIRQGITWRIDQTTGECDTIAEAVGPDTDGDGDLEVLQKCNPWREGVTDTDGDGGSCDNIMYMGDERGGCRIIAIPVVGGDELPPPPGQVTNLEFALFWLEPLGQCTGNDCEIKGYWIDAEVSVSGLLGVLDPSTTPFTVVKLVE